MKKYDVIAIGELNVDLILNEINGAIEVGKEKFARNLTLTLGSSTAIFAANAASLGLQTGFAGMIGKDSFGALIKASLLGKGVTTDYLIEREDKNSGATIVLNYGEDRAMVTYQGAMEYMGFDDIDKQVFEETRHIHLSSIFNQPRLQQDLFRLLSYAGERGITSSLDTQWDPLEKWDFNYRKLLPLITVFMPNEKELTHITASETVEEALEKIKPYANHCVVKKGCLGSVVYPKGEKEGISLPAFINKETIDAIGAGDSFNAGFIYQFVKGASLKDCQYFGNLMGAVSTTAPGGTGAFANRENIAEIARSKFNQKIIW